MTSSTTFSQEQLAEAQPVENEMYKREGFDRKNIRYEFANVQPISLEDRYVEEEERLYVDPRTTEMPHGPTGLGEFKGAGVDFIRQEGGVHPTYRFTQGFQTLAEDARTGAVDLSRQRRKVAETFDFLADSMFLTGVQNANGTQVRQGVFEWLKSNIPAERTFDCDLYDGDSGDPEDYVTDKVQENIIKYDAYETISGRINDTGQWDVVIGNQKALARLNKRRPADGGIAPRDTYWDALNEPNKGEGVGIRRKMLVPNTLTFSEAPEGMSPLQIDLSAQLADNELIILPDMEQVRDKYWRLREMPAPWHPEPYRQRGGETLFDYVWRYGHSFDPYRAYSDATDAIHLTNIDQLFV